VLPLEGDRIANCNSFNGDTVAQNTMQQARSQFETIIKSNLIWWLLIAFGILLRVRQYLTGRSLWSDEASLALNLVSRNFVELTQPLDYHQGAPIGFLFIEKLAILLLGNNEYVLRLFPLLSGIMAIYLLYLIARRYFGISGMFALLAFSVGWYLIYYSSELKQYSSDVMIALLLVYLASRCIEQDVRARDFLVLALGGVVGMWISHPSAFVLAGIGLVLFIEKLRRKEYVPFAWIIAIGILWSGSFMLEYFISLKRLAADEFMQEYWDKAFVPLPPWSNWSWFLKTYYSILLMSLNTHITAFFMVAALAVIGTLSLLIRNRTVALLIISPGIITFIASALQKYPLKDRFMLFLVPFLFLLLSEGLQRIFTLTAKWNHNLAFVLVGLPVALLTWAPGTTLDQFFYTTRGSDVRPVIQYVAANRQPDEIVYVYHSSEPAFYYYAPFYGLNNGEIVVGFDTVRKRVALNGFFDDVEKLKGNDRVWFIFSDIVDCGSCEGDKQAFYVDYLNEFGVILDEFHASDANTYLYDLNP
jgi:hypothetical protein